MIAAHLETMYAQYEIELVVIRAEEAYDPALVERLRAYGQQSEAAAASRVAHAVSVDLTQPGAHFPSSTSDTRPDTTRQSFPSRLPLPPPNPRSNPLLLS